MYVCMYVFEYQQAYEEPPKFSDGAVGKLGLKEYMTKGYLSSENRGTYIHNIHTLIYTYLRTYIHAYCLFLKKQTYIHIFIDTYIHTFISITFYSSIYAHIYTYIHTDLPTSTCIHSCIHTCIQTYIHTSIHTYIYTYIPSPKLSLIHTYRSGSSESNSGLRLRRFFHISSANRDGHLPTIR